MNYKKTNKSGQDNEHKKRKRIETQTEKKWENEMKKCTNVFVL